MFRLNKINSMAQTNNSRNSLVTLVTLKCSLLLVFIIKSKKMFELKQKQTLHYSKVYLTGNKSLSYL